MVGAMRPDQQGYLLWPSEEAPQFAFRPSAVGPALWLRETFEPRGRGGRFARPHVWQALRSRALVFGDASDVWRVAAERALGRPLDDPEVAIASTSGCLNKITLFVFEGEAPQPIAVAKVMSDPSRRDWLAREYRLLEEVRALVAGDPELVATLPEPPLFAGNVGAEYVAIEAFDDVAEGIGQLPRPATLSLLDRLQRVTTQRHRRWTAEDVASTLAAMERNVERLGRCPEAPALFERTRVALEGAVGTTLPDTVVHGDYWPGNIARCGDRVRLFDWEWGESAGNPAFDRWTYELADVRSRAASGTAGIAEVLDAAMADVTDSLGDLAVDPHLARGMLAPSALRLVTRIRLEASRENGWESAAPGMLAAIEEVLS
ncbi:MAG: hypothetical protein QOI80_1234 [Solirubrobacteraceae bacterium]|nr:hypothetical protein [Solirubrobacteraceae bacterium]